MTNHKCKYCEYVFKDEEDKLSHTCKLLDREAESKQSKNFLVAWSLFKYWRELYGQATLSREVFIQSKYYTSFIKFLDFARAKSLPDRKHYIKFCKSKNLLPNLWRVEQVYLEYLIFFDTDVSPVKQFDISVEMINSLAEFLECPHNKVISFLNFDEVSKMVYQKNLSPWYLLFSGSFEKMYRGLTQGERIICDSLIDREKWLKLFRDNKDIVKMILNKASEIKI